MLEYGDHVQPPNGTELQVRDATGVNYIRITPTGLIQVPGIQSDGRGNLTISGTNNTGAIVYSVTKAAAGFVILTPTASTGTPAVGSNRVLSVAKTTTGFTVTLEAAPGAGNSVTFDWTNIQ